MTTVQLHTWDQVTQLHSDVEAGNPTEALFTVDLGGIATADPSVPAVYREPESFFRATYLTPGMHHLLEEILTSLSAKPGYSRVVKLRTPFGGGKSHTLALLFHAARSRQALHLLPLTEGPPDPGDVDVAVFDGEKFDARDGVALPDGRRVLTMWGWLAWQLGDKYYSIVQGHDEDRTSPGGDVIKLLLRGKPKLFLLDHVLNYMERAASVAVTESSLQRQSLDFLQSFTAAVSNNMKSAMVYSLPNSAAEALGNEALLEQLDNLTDRVGQLQEPVTSEDVPYIIHHRLLAALPDEDAANTAALAYRDAVAAADGADEPSAAEHQQVDGKGTEFHQRVKTLYPVHPALIDILQGRWSSLDGFQQTRGTLRFLASCLYATKQSGIARTVLGPGDIPLDDKEMRLKLVEELGLQNDYDSALNADICGPSARAKRIDDRLELQYPALAGVRPASRLATAIFMYSFGGLRRGDGDREPFNPGVTESELLASVIGPDLDYSTAVGVLAELRDACLYLHHEDAYYVFKKFPNINKLVEDEERHVIRNPGEVHRRVKEIMLRRLNGQRSAIVWPKVSVQLPDAEPTFLIGYLPLEFTAQTGDIQQQQAMELFESHGDQARRYRNGLGLAIPQQDQVEPLLRAVCHLMAIERVEAKRDQYRLTPNDFRQINHRKRSQEAVLDRAFRQLYTSLWLPRSDNGSLKLESVEADGRALQSTGFHERVIELLNNTKKLLLTSITPRQIVDLMHLGEGAAGHQPKLGVKTANVRDAFFSFLSFPRIDTCDTLRAAIAKGVREGTFGYTSGLFPTLGPDGRYLIPLNNLVYETAITQDEIDLDKGFIMMPVSIRTGTEPARMDSPNRLLRGPGVPYSRHGAASPSVRSASTAIATEDVAKVGPLQISRARDQGISPEIIKEDFEAARLVLPVSPKASAALSRRCLQTMLRDQGYGGEELSIQIDYALPHLPDDIGTMVDSIRKVGDFEANPIKSKATGEIVAIKPGEAEWSIEVLEELFDYFYARPARIATKREALNTKLGETGDSPSFETT